ncbi:hypothetical protein MM716_30200, partial [Klebsiella pneumoniae]|nr:hypothetical protein [Klebsiella pneumoniae]
MNDGFGRCLEGVLIRLEFEFFAFFAAAYALVVAVACIVAVAPAFSAFAFGVSALTFVIAVAAVFFFRFCRIDRFIFDGWRGCLRFLGRFGGTLSAGFGFLCGFCLLFCL